MNKETLSKFGDIVKKEGVVIINSNMVSVPEDFRKDVQLIEVPCLNLAEEIHHPKGANIIMSGVIIKKTGNFTMQEAIDGMNDTFRRKGKEKFEALNTAAMKTGFTFT